MAPLTFHVLLTCLLCLLRTGNGQDGPTTITVTPATLTLMPSASDGTGGQVTISCRASSVLTGEVLTVINIQRVLYVNPNAAPVEVVAASQANTDAVLQLTSLQCSATVSGTLNGKTITLNLNRANCGDAGMYICNAHSVSGSEAKMYTSSRNLTIEVSPGSITMTTEPSGVNNWRVNDKLLMRCNGIVGTVQDDSQVEWIWQYQDRNRFAGVENWQPYSDIGDSSADIQTESSPTTNSCYKRQISILTRHLTLDDTDREYRCYVINNDVSGSQNAQANAQVISVGTVSESGVVPITPGMSPGSALKSPTMTTETDKSKDDRLKICDCPDVGVIIGAVVAVLSVIDVVILAVVIIVLKRRMMEPAAQTKSEETRGNDNQMSSVADVSRPVEQRPVTIAENHSTYDGLIMRDVGVASLYQDLGSPYELPR